MSKARLMAGTIESQTHDFGIWLQKMLKSNIRFTVTTYRNAPSRHRSIQSNRVEVEMTAISHIAIKVDDLDGAKAFYMQVFGFKHISTDRVRDHVSCHLSDGNIDVALIKYDADSTTAEAKAAGDGPAIHHIGFAVDDVERVRRQLVEQGCKIISDPGVLPIKFRAPGGTVAEIAPETHFKAAKSST